MSFNPITAIDQAIECIENGRNDEALLHLNMARTKVSKNILDDGIFALHHDDSIVNLPAMTNRIEVIDHGRKDDCRQVMSMTAAGGEIQLQDQGRTLKLFIRSQSNDKV